MAFHQRADSGHSGGNQQHFAGDANGDRCRDMPPQQTHAQYMRVLRADGNDEPGAEAESFQVGGQHVSSVARRCGIMAGFPCMRISVTLIRAARKLLR
jgi:hypothetical protein